MKRLLQPRLAWLAARRVGGWIVAAWVVAVLVFAVATRPTQEPAFAHDLPQHLRERLESMHGGEQRSEEGVNGPTFGLARQHVWAAFLLGVAPLLLLRAARRVAPRATDDAAWLATRPVANAVITLSTWSGTFGAWCLAVLPFALASEFGAPADERLFEAWGEVPVPETRWFSGTEPLRWTVTLPDAATTGGLASVEVGIASSPASGNVIRTRARAASSEPWLEEERRIATRGRVEFLVPSGARTLELEIGCEPAGTRAVLVSDASLWRGTRAPFPAGRRILERLLAAGAVWCALVLAFAGYVGATTATGGVLAGWVAVWMSDLQPSVTRWIPAADLFDALEIVGAGRAPTPLAGATWLGAALLTLGALFLGTASLARWRVSR